LALPLGGVPYFQRPSSCKISTPHSFWLKRREKNSHSKEVLFIDATEMGFMKDRVHRDLAPKDIAKIKDTYHNWRKGENYQNEKGFCKSAQYR
jgi:type I restriction enzyme M protein